MGGAALSFQISAIALYGPDPEPRVLTLWTGKLNIITGSSKTGKSSLISIVDYCLGASECNVAHGPIRDTVKWYGLKLTKENEEVFIARKAPRNGQNANAAVYYDIGRRVNIPNKKEITQTTNIDAAVQLLSRFAGIVDNIHETPEGQTRPDLAASIKHALHFCFQPQDEIISRKNLFYQQNQQFIPQAIKDSLPFFLGAIGDDHIIKVSKLRLLKQELTRTKRKLAEAEAIKGQGTTRATRLLSEAVDCGLVEDPQEELSLGELSRLLRDILERRVPSNVTLPPEETIGYQEERFAEIPTNFPQIERPHYLDTYDRLILEQEEKTRKLRRIDQDLRGARSLIAYQDGYATEANESIGRLKSIGIFPENGDKNKVCPLCSSSITNIPEPEEDEMKNALQELEQSLVDISHNNPHLEQLIAQLENQFSEVRKELAVNREALENLQRTQKQVAEYRDFVAKAAHIRGRISIYLEAVPEDVPVSSELEKKVTKLTKEIKELEAELDDETIEERVQSILSVLSHRITELSRKLDLEHSEHPIRFDDRKLTVVADAQQQGPISMDKMGSGANWVGYHIVVHLALHQLFVEHQRPVPRFLFLDQPSQVYFPADRDVKGQLEIGRGGATIDEDRVAVLEMFKLVKDSVSNLEGKFQIIVTEHADPENAWYQEAVIERWRDGNTLVPTDWIDKSPH